MGLTSLQVCMDSSDWLQGTIHEDESALGGLSTNNNSSSSPSTDGCGVDNVSHNVMGSSGPMRLKPPADQAQKCPRCDSAHTKFCYYNNYSLTQPRYFCKTCRRYWTKGGTLRNIPVGGGCRKNNSSHKKHSNKRTNSNPNPNVSNDHIISTNVVNNNHTDLQLSTLIGAHHNNNLNNYNNNNVPNFLDGRYGAVDFSDHKNIEALRNYDLIGNININSNSNNNNNNNVGHDNDDHSHVGMSMDHHLQTTSSLVPSFQGLCSPFGIMGLDQHGYVDSSYQRFMLPYDVAFENQNAASIDVKPKLLALDQWQDVGNRECFSGYNNMGSWSNMMINGYNGSS